MRGLTRLSFASEKSRHILNELDRVRQTLVAARQHILDDVSAHGSDRPDAIDVSLAAPFLVGDNVTSGQAQFPGFKVDRRSVPPPRRERVRTALEKIDEIIRQIDFTRFEISRRISPQASPLDSMRKFISQQHFSLRLKKRQAA
ncbi:MAG: hypothetical protein ACFCUR_10855 [Rhodomicrobiaceae bacterium]